MIQRRCSPRREVLWGVCWGGLRGECGGSGSAPVAAVAAGLAAGPGKLARVVRGDVGGEPVGVVKGVGGQLRGEGGGPAVGEAAGPTGGEPAGAGRRVAGGARDVPAEVPPAREERGVGEGRDGGCEGDDLRHRRLHMRAKNAGVIKQGLRASRARAAPAGPRRYRSAWERRGRAPGGRAPQRRGRRGGRCSSRRAAPRRARRAPDGC